MEQRKIMHILSGLAALSRDRSNKSPLVNSPRRIRCSSNLRFSCCERAFLRGILENFFHFPRSPPSATFYEVLSLLCVLKFSVLACDSQRADSTCAALFARRRLFVVFRRLHLQKENPSKKKCHRRSISQTVRTLSQRSEKKNRPVGHDTFSELKFNE